MYPIAKSAAKEELIMHLLSLAVLKFKISSPRWLPVEILYTSSNIK
jgi:hypothetical protein